MGYVIKDMQEWMQVHEINQPSLQHVYARASTTVQSTSKPFISGSVVYGLVIGAALVAIAAVLAFVAIRPKTTAKATTQSHNHTEVPSPVDAPLQPDSETYTGKCKERMTITPTDEIEMMEMNFEPASSQVDYSKPCSSYS
ncbi:hypothetical protein QVD99_003063 [Batrachochytrium dendrobatidis]|nr:hypothetical protein QVD99_003063 [Batrachochytrium dendrobatidis]